MALFQPFRKATRPETPGYAAAELAETKAENEARARVNALRSGNILGGAQLYNAAMGDRSPIADYLFGAPEAASVAAGAPVTMGGSAALPAQLGGPGTAAMAAETAGLAGAGAGAAGTAGSSALAGMGPAGWAALAGLALMNFL